MAVKFLKIKESDSSEFLDWGGIIYTKHVPFCDMQWTFADEVKIAGKYLTFIDTFVIYVNGGNTLKEKISSMKIGEIIEVKGWKVKKVSEHFVRVWK